VSRIFDNTSYLGDFVADGFAPGDGFPAGLVADAPVAGDAAGVAAAGDATGDAPGEGVGEATGTASDCNTELDPLIPGNDNNKPISMKQIAAPIVILAKMF
jgi:hypothetical protein